MIPAEGGTDHFALWSACRWRLSAIAVGTLGRRAWPIRIPLRPRNRREICRVHDKHERRSIPGACFPGLVTFFFFFFFPVYPALRRNVTLGAVVGACARTTWLFFPELGCPRPGSHSRDGGGGLVRSGMGTCAPCLPPFRVWGLGILAALCRPGMDSPFARFSVLTGPPGFSAPSLER